MIDSELSSVEYSVVAGKVELAANREEVAGFSNWKK